MVFRVWASVVVHRLSCPLACGIEAVSPALAGGVLTTGPAGKSKAGFLKDFVMVRLGRKE